MRGILHEETHCVAAIMARDGDQAPQAPEMLGIYMHDASW